MAKKNEAVDSPDVGTEAVTETKAAPAPKKKKPVIEEPTFGSKKVYLRRRPIHGHLPKEISAEAEQVLGSVFKNRQPLKAFDSKEDEIKYLEPLLDVDSSDREWSRYVRRFYAEQRVKVGFAGRELEVGTDQNDWPLALSDFIIYKFALAHPLVADSEVEMMAKSNMRFYLQDPTKDSKKKHNSIQVAKHADREFIKASDNRVRMKNLLRILAEGISVERLDGESVENMLYDIKVSSPQKFLKAALDKDVDIQAEVLSFIESGTLTRIGSAVYYYDEIVGENINEAILYMKNPKRSTSLNSMRVKHKELTA